MSQQTATQINSATTVFGLRDQVYRLAGDLNLIANLATVPKLCEGRLGHTEMLDLFQQIGAIAARATNQISEERLKQL